jgi:hypothetical protein
MQQYFCKLGLCISFILLANGVIAQRDYYNRDSTSYKISEQKTFIAGKRNLYVIKNNELSHLKDFTVQGDSTFYIRDVDFIDENKGYVLVGRMYIGGSTNLYYTSDGGENFSLDTSYYSASQHKSINQVQYLDNNTVILFDGYYDSGLLKSLDGGRTWETWFYSLIAHYFQMHKCQNGTWYLIGTPGDGFSSYSFPLADSMWSIKDLPSYWSGCHNSAPYCIRVLRDGSSDRETDFIAKQIDTLTKVCGVKTSIAETIKKTEVKIYPNPFFGKCWIENGKNKWYQLFDSKGGLLQKGYIEDNKMELDFSHFPAGLYFISIDQQYDKILVIAN